MIRVFKVANIAKQTITKSKQKAFLTLFDKIIERKGSENKALSFAGINKETMWRWKNDRFMTLATGQKILQAYNKDT